MTSRAKCAAFLAVLAIAAAACAGAAARDRLMPVMAAAFRNIAPEIENGVRAQGLDAASADAVRIAVVAVQHALDTGNRSGLLLISWDSLAELARAGIMARVVTGDISVGVAQGKLERLKLFGQNWNKATER